MIRLLFGITLMVSGFALMKSSAPDWATWIGLVALVSGILLILNPRFAFQRRGDH